MPSLNLRLTFKYVGTWKHEDDWRYLGSYEVVARSEREITDETDMCEPFRQTLFVEVSTEQKEKPKTIETALHDELTIAGCSHEYDCCGCYSVYATAKQVKGNLYKVTLSGARNY